MSNVLQQNINLYQSAFRTQRQLFSLPMMLQSTAAVVVLLMSIYFFGLWQIRAVEAEAARLDGFEKAKTVQLADLDPDSGIKRRGDFDSELTALTNAVVEQQRLIDVLEARPLGSNAGFSGLLTALAQHHTEGLWLDRITINGANSAIELMGRSYLPEAVPSYLQNLSNSSVLAGQRFDHFLLERPKVDEQGEVIRGVVPGNINLERASEFFFRVASRQVESADQAR